MCAVPSSLIKQRDDDIMAAALLYCCHQLVKAIVPFYYLQLISNPLLTLNCNVMFPLFNLTSSLYSLIHFLYHFLALIQEFGSLQLIAPLPVCQKHLSCHLAKMQSISPTITNCVSQGLGSIQRRPKQIVFEEAGS